MNIEEELKEAKKTLKEEGIAFVTSKLAKEKGFNIHIAFFNKCYDQNGDRVPVIDVARSIDKWYKEGYAIVTQSVLQKWLRDVHNIHIDIRACGYEKVHFELKVGKGTVLRYFYADKTFKDTGLIPFGFETYEEALETGLQEALKLI